MDSSLLMLFLTSWAEFAVRWLHVITAIAWIGSSFYFIALDLGLRKHDSLPVGAAAGTAGAWRWLLSYSKISGCPGKSARTSDLV